MSATGPEDSIQGVEDVARAYEAAAFDDQPPAQVDRAILAAARRRPRPRLAVFFPAFALAATVILSFSLVLRSGLLGIGGVDVPGAQDPISAGDFRSSEEPAGAGSLEDDRGAGASIPEGSFVDAPREEGLPSTPAPGRERALNEPPPPVLQQRAQPATSAVDRDSAVTAPAQAQPAPESLSAELELEEAAVLRSVVAPEAPEACSAVSGGDPAVWVACIAQQLEAGEEEIARSELDTFVGIHPDFPLPEDLQALRGP